MTTASSLERTGDLSLYGTISMALMIGLLLGGLILALIDHGDETAPAIMPILAAARADQLRRAAVLGTPTDEHPIVTPMDLPPRGAGITVDTQTPGRHRIDLADRHGRIVKRPASFALMTLREAQVWLAIDRVHREAERSQFQQLMGTFAH